MTMTISQKGIDLVKSFESCVLHPYRDSAGRWTIGWGHLIRDTEQFGDSISQATADMLLNGDLEWTDQMVNRLVKVELTQNRFDSLCDWTFNLGCGTLAKSTLLVKLNAGDFDAVPDLMLAFCHCGGTVNDGLLRRRKAEVALFTLL